MSSLFTGNSSITPWIDPVVFDAVTGTTPVAPYKPKLVQVIAATTTSNPVTEAGTNPRILRVSDGTTHIAAVLTEPVWNDLVAQQLVQQEHEGREGGMVVNRGCIVRITDWRVYPADAAVAMSLSKQSMPENNTNSSDEDWLQWIQNSSHCMNMAGPQVVLLISGSVQVLGGQGLGIVGDPVDVHRTVDVQRALVSIGFNKGVLRERLLPGNANVTATNAGADPAADLPVGDVAALFSSNDGGEAFAATVATTAAATASPPAQLTAENNANAAMIVDWPSLNQRSDVDHVTAAESDALTAMHDLFSNVIQAGKTQEGGARDTDRTTTGPATMPTTRATTRASTRATTAATATAAAGTPPLPVPDFAVTNLAHALQEESPRRKRSANDPASQEVMSPDGERYEREDDDEQNMGISDMLITSQEDGMDNGNALESQEPRTWEQRVEAENEALFESCEDAESEQGLETQLPGPIDSHEDLHGAQSNNVAESGTAAAASPGTATTAAQTNGSSPSRKRRRYFDERTEWVNMDLVDLGVVAVPRTADTPMLTMEKLWHRMASSTMPRKQPPRRTESTTNALGGDGLRALLLEGSD
jgi:hypothetical protein